MGLGREGFIQAVHPALLPKPVSRVELGISRFRVGGSMNDPVGCENRDVSKMMDSSVPRADRATAESGTTEGIGG
jgi:hypothetical protein